MADLGELRGSLGNIGKLLGISRNFGGSRSSPRFPELPRSSPWFPKLPRCSPRFPELPRDARGSQSSLRVPKSPLTSPEVSRTLPRFPELPRSSPEDFLSSHEVNRASPIPRAPPRFSEVLLRASPGDLRELRGSSVQPRGSSGNFGGNLGGV